MPARTARIRRAPRRYASIAMAINSSLVMASAMAEYQGNRRVGNYIGICMDLDRT